MKTLLLSYRDHTAPHCGGAVHGFHVVEQLRRLGYELSTLEAKSDARLTRYPRTIAGLHAALGNADGIYVRCDARPGVGLLLEANRRYYHRPVVLELNAVPEEALVRGGRFAGLRARARGYGYAHLARAAQAVVCVSEPLAAFAARELGVPEPRIFVAPNGGTPQSNPPSPRADDEVRLVWAGDARYPWQALDQVLAAFFELVRLEPRARLFVFTPAPAAGLPKHPALSIRHALPHAELCAQLSQMDVALCLYRDLPASSVGFYLSPLKLFDAMAAGLSVVASALGQLGEVVEHGKSGWLVGPALSATVGALVTLARSPELRRRLGCAAQQRIRERFSWDHTGAALGRALAVAGV